MSWYCSHTCLCKKCGYTYNEDISTFTIGRKDFRKCPKCSEEVKVISKQNKNNKFIEKLNKIYSKN